MVSNPVSHNSRLSVFDSGLLKLTWSLKIDWVSWQWRSVGEMGEPLIA